jgi:hypothetical protein
LRQPQSVYRARRLTSTFGVILGIHSCRRIEALGGGLSEAFNEERAEGGEMHACDFNILQKLPSALWISVTRRYSIAHDVTGGE